jgi:hypothetical protein
VRKPADRYAQSVIASEAKQSRESKNWIASSQGLLAMTEDPHSISVNCSSSVSWIIEKLSSGIMVSTVSPSGVTPIRF